MQSVPSLTAMGFYHSKGHVPSWKQAQRFIGDTGGRIATMPDIVDVRLAAGVDDHPWNTYYTTTTAEYFGYSKGGVRILVIAHGIGPMSTISGILKAYSYEYKDKSRNRNGGRISMEKFHKLADGHYGDVSVVEFDPIVSRYKYPFIGHITVSQALNEPLLAARFGPRFEEYIFHHAKMAHAWHAEQAGINPENRHNLPAGDWNLHLVRRRMDHMKCSNDEYDPVILKMGDPGDCSYTAGGFAGHPRVYRQLDKGDGALAHLVSVGRLEHAHLSGYPQREALACDVSAHGWTNGVRFVGIRGPGRISDIHPGPEGAWRIVRDQWKDLLIPIDPPAEPRRLYRIMERDGVWFTQYKEPGDVMDGSEVEFHVRSATPIGEPVNFVTETLGYHGFFKYELSGIEALMPDGANAYRFVSNPENIWTDGNPDHQQAMVQFYQADVDTSARIMKPEQLENDFDLLMLLLEQKLAA